MSGRHYSRERAALAALIALLLVVAVAARSFYTSDNLRDIAVNNASWLIVALGMTVVILAGQIDISVGSQFAVCTVAAGLLAKAGVPIALLLPAVAVVGAALGAINGALVGLLGLPSIIVTLAMLVIWRDALRWATGGAWVQGLPADFQWLGIGPRAAQALIVVIPLVVVAAMHWILQNVRVGRAVHAVGCDAEAARLAGISPLGVTFAVFTLMGAMAGVAATLDAVRFASLPSNAGTGLELAAIAAVVVGGASITGGRGTVIGTLIGVMLLAIIAPALTFLGINPYWEKAIQGLIILAALGSDAALDKLDVHVKRLTVARAATY
jgi:rhamnose transport system permease protein